MAARSARAAFFIAIAVVATTPATGLAAGRSPSPSPTGPEDTGLDAPPAAWFAPAMIRTVMTRNGQVDRIDEDEGLYVGAIDGSDLTPVQAPEAFGASLAADGRILLFGRAAADGPSPLLVRDGDGTLRTLAHEAGYAVLDADRDEAYAYRGPRTDFLTGRELWRFPLDGSAPTRVMKKHPEQERIVLSADGRSVAVGSMGTPGSSMLRARFAGGPERDLGDGWPIGFDPSGRLISGDAEMLGRYDPRTGDREPLGLRRLGHLEDVRLTPSGRYLVATYEKDGRSRIHVRDLVDGDRRDHDLGEFSVSLAVVDDRYVVGQRHAAAADDFGIDSIVVLDLLEGWVGVIPWQIETSPAPWPSASSPEPIARPAPFTSARPAAP